MKSSENHNWSGIDLTLRVRRNFLSLDKIAPDRQIHVIMKFVH